MLPQPTPQVFGLGVHLVTHYALNQRSFSFTHLQRHAYLRRRQPHPRRRSHRFHHGPHEPQQLLTTQPVLWHLQRRLQAREESGSPLNTTQPALLPRHRSRLLSTRSRLAAAHMRKSI